ncbi:hypothetical protein [Bifidobacterium xylocopae]|uniref:Uncharacterized protein n=1 Tax=Bifidobacterium xylocopae TaxID=2493119 RepID=A0A366KB09_9BIFI|nr:hypothetical protein [Bifidobacterium xylocopae]RBP98915.1 hypothetical protein CRD59_06675 [Bifidobacterium xylocopae]
MSWLDDLGDQLSSLNPMNLIASGLGKIMDSIFNILAQLISDAVAEAAKEFSTMWMSIPTPDISGNGESMAIPQDTSGVVTILGYAKWVCYVIAVVALILAALRFVIKARHGDATAGLGKVGMVLVGVVVISAAAGLVSSAIAGGPTGVGGAVAMIQSHLWWYMQVAAVLSVLLGVGRMMWFERAEEGRDTVKSILTLVIVAGAGAPICSTLLTVGDSFSSWILGAAADTDFGTSLSKALIFSTVMPGGPIMVALVGILCLVAELVQMVAMIIRSGLLVLMMGVLPLTSANTNSAWGKQWFQRSLGWLAAFILYKPVASIIYAICFKMIGGNAFGTQEGGVSGVLVGFAFMVMAIVALPGLMKFAVPAVAAISSGGGSAAGGMMSAALPTGAMMLSRGAGSSSASTTSGSSAGTSAGPSGSSAGAPSQSGSPMTVQSAGTASAGTSAGASSAAGAGAAAGPVGVAVEAGVQGVKVAAGAVRQSVADSSDGADSAPPQGASSHESGSSVQSASAVDKSAKPDGAANHGLDGQASGA